MSAAAPSQPAHDFLAPVLFSLIGEVRRSAERVAAGRRAGTTLDPEAIHDFRVALRRLRTVLRSARRIYGKRKVKAIGAELRRFAQVAGAVRDDEVLRETLAELPLPPRPRADVDAWLGRRSRQEQARRRAVVALLTASGEASLGLALAHLERLVAERRDEFLAADLAHAALGEALEGVRELAASSPRDGNAMHALRIRFKRLRYTAELFAPVLGDAAAGIARSSARMQKRLGELHDLDEAMLRLARSRTLSDPVHARARRALLQARVERSRRARADLEDELKALFGPDR